MFERTLDLVLKRSCEAKICSCPSGGDGHQATGDACPFHGAQKCISCPSGYELQPGGSCVSKVCTCAFGTGATGTDCPMHGSTMCSDCDNGFHLAEE